MLVSLTINGEIKVLEISPDDFLADTLRKNGYTSVKTGCDEATCGSCTVWIDERPVLSCSVPAAQAEGKKITTLEGVQQEAEVLAKFLVAEGVVQCGYCIPGLIMTVLAMKRELTCPTEQEIKHYITGNLCRCSGYMGQMRAIMKYIELE